MAHKSLWHQDGETLTLDLHPGQAEAWTAPERFVFVIAGAQSGKTSYGPWWTWKEIQQTADPAGGTNDYIAATASFDLFKLKMLPELRAAFEHTLKVGRYWSGDRVIELKDPATGQFWAERADDPMWGRIVLRSAASGGGLESITARGAWLDECGQDEFTVETWEAVQRRLALFRGRVLGTTTPYNLGWLKTEIVDRWEAGDPDYRVVNFASTLNPLFSPEEFARLERTMEASRFRMFYLGLMGRPPGLIYDCFEEAENVVDDFPIPGTWKRYVGHDFGGVNTALVWIAEDPDSGVYYLYRESLDGGKTTKEHVDAAKAAAVGVNVVRRVGGSGSEDQQRRDWGREGWKIERPPVVDVQSGIDAVYGLLKPRVLKVFRSCKGTRDEIGTYKRKMDPNTGEPTEEILDKRKFHRLDALRYVGTVLRNPHKAKFRPL
jgi:hypothetical protein